MTLTLTLTLTHTLSLSLTLTLTLNLALTLTLTLTRLQLRDAVQKTAKTTGKLYLTLDTQTEVLIEGDHAAGPADAADAADGADAAMASAAPTPLGLLVQGIGRQGGMHRIHVALRKVWSIELRWRCAGSGPFG